MQSLASSWLRAGSPARIRPQPSTSFARAVAETSKRARATIAELGERFIRKGATVLVHGHSRVAIAILRKAAAAVRAAGTRAWPLGGAGVTMQAWHCAGALQAAWPRRGGGAAASVRVLAWRPPPAFLPHGPPPPALPHCHYDLAHRPFRPTPTPNPTLTQHPYPLPPPCRASSSA